ncbi:MAG: hypothetical protein ABIP28_01660 [Mucilaginibacter sp.]
MESILITPKTKIEAKLISDLLEKMNITSKILSEEEKEDMGLVMMMKEVDRDEKVSREDVMSKLKA